MFEKLGGRKMVAATLTMAVGVTVAVWKGDIPPNLLQLLEIVFGVFAGANAINTIGGLTLNRVKAPEIPVDHAVQAFSELTTNVKDQSAQTQQMLDSIIKSTQLTQNALSVIAEKVLSK
jgi:hypothetical protein